jgi:CBS domain containing-hemolysin-like protein
MEEISLASLLWRGLAVLVLVAANAFFVAAEFSLVASRRTRIEALARQGDRQAKLVQKAIQSLDRYISATQLGITLASLGLGWIGEPAVASVFERLFQGWPSPFDLVATHAVATTIAFTLITVLHIVLGELAPKALALLHPEATSRWVVAPLIGFTIATNPFIWVLNGAANATLRIFGMRAPTESERVHRPEEIVMLVKQSQESGHLARQDVRLIEGVFEFSEKTARDVMTPRTDVIALEETLTVEEAAQRIGDAGRSRYPVYGESADDVVGVIHAKQILANLGKAKYQKLRAIVSEPLFVPGSREVEDLLTDMKRAKRHMAIVVDEYGGTAGVVTMEDLLEEIVGEIYDEYDRTEVQPSTSGAERTLPGNMEIAEANKRYGLGIETDQFQTVGGFVFGTLGRLPKEGDVVPVNDARLEVLKMDKRRVATLKITAGP